MSASHLLGLQGPQQTPAIMICIEVDSYNVSDSLGPNWMKKKQYLPHLQTFESGLSFSKTELEII